MNTPTVVRVTHFCIDSLFKKIGICAQMRFRPSLLLIFFVLWYCFIHKDRVSMALQFQDHKGLDNNILLTQCLDNNPKRILIYSPSIICTFVHKCHHLVYSIFCKISVVLCCWFQCYQLLHWFHEKNSNWGRITQCGN